MNILNEIKVEDVREDKEKIIVTTTGARYFIEKEKGKISCYQLLNKERLITTIDFNCSFPTLSVERKDETACILFFQSSIEGYKSGKESDSLKLQINRDSLLEISCQTGLNLTISSGDFLPDYIVEKNGNILLIDDAGGIGIYPYKGLRNKEFTDFTSKSWKIEYTASRTETSYPRFLISIFPPRKFNYNQSFKDRISHHGALGAGDIPVEPYPSDREIEELSKYTNILVLHCFIWQGKLTRQGIQLKTWDDTYLDGSWMMYNFIPVNEKELTRVIKKAHSLGVRVIPYTSPHYSIAKGKDFLDKVKDIVEKYDFDGIYYDDISMDDILYSYDMMRNTRELLKDKIIYYHCTLGPLRSKNIYCPFVDTYADYIIRAEEIPEFDEKYLRYVISGYNISNSIGYICHYRSSLDFIQKTIDKALSVNARFYLGLPETEREKLLKREYFPKLEEAYKKK